VSFIVKAQERALASNPPPLNEAETTCAFGRLWYAIHGRMVLMRQPITYLMEGTTMTKARLGKEFEKAVMRLRNIENKFAGDDDKIFQHIMLRSDRMTKPEKISIWKKVLWQMGHRRASQLS